MKRKRMEPPAAVAIVAIYGAALVKALLVAIYFMHLRSERLLILALVIIPLTLFIVLTVSLIPDFVAPLSHR